MVLACVAAVAVCAGGTVLAAELLAPRYGDGIKLAIYQGGIAGGVLGLIGLPFAIVLSRIGKGGTNDARFWTWWGSGFLLRLALLGVASKVLDAVCATEFHTAASMTMAALYLIGMFSEMAWLASVLLKNEKQTVYKKA